MLACVSLAPRREESMGFARPLEVQSSLGAQRGVSVGIAGQRFVWHTFEGTGRLASFPISRGQTGPYRLVAYVPKDLAYRLVAYAPKERLPAEKQSEIEVGAKRPPQLHLDFRPPTSTSPQFPLDLRPPTSISPRFSAGGPPRF